MTNVCDRNTRSVMIRPLLAGVFSIVSMSAAQATTCGGAEFPFPYTDVASVATASCPGILEAYVTGVTNGTTPTTFSPNSVVDRSQLTTFLKRSLDQGLTRSSRRAALGQWWAPKTVEAMQSILVDGLPAGCAADGENIWIANHFYLSKLNASTGEATGSWNASEVNSVLVVGGKIYGAGGFDGKESLYMVDPTKPTGPATVAATGLGQQPFGITFDGANIWTANLHSLSKIPLTASPPFSVTNISNGFMTLAGITFDGTNVWVTDSVAGKLFKLDDAGAIIQTVDVGVIPGRPTFDGANLWIPNQLDSIVVVQARTGNILARIQGDAINKVHMPVFAAFDGERILVANYHPDSVSVFKAADLSFIANVPLPLGSGPHAPCSDGINFWINAPGFGQLYRF